MFPIRRPLLPLLIAASLLIATGCAPASTPSPGASTLPPTQAPATVPGGSEEPSQASAEPTSEPPTPEATPTSGATSGPSASPGATIVLRAYFVLGSFTGNEGLVPVVRRVPETKAVAEAAMEALLAGPSKAEMSVSPAIYTAIPDGTALRGVSVKDGTATVDLTGAFDDGGGTYALTARLGQVVYTLTQFSTVTRVRFLVDGVPVTTFGSEGIVIDGPVGRADYYGVLPAIFVDRPAWGAALGNPGKVSGLANVFEARFRVQLLDAKGNSLLDEPVDASCGTGCWGRFSTTLSYTVAKGQYGTLRVYDLSAKDGSKEHVTEYRVWLSPAG